MMKRHTLLLLTALLSVLPTPSMAMQDDGTTAQALRFNQDGRFVILHLTDFHKYLNGLYDAMNNILIRKFVENEKPDLVVLTGDIAMDGTLDQVLVNIDTIMSLFDKLHVPVAVTFGNHDSEKGIISREDLMAVYNSYPCSISVDDGNLLPGCGTYNIPILASDSNSVAFNIWVVDSGEYDGEGRYGYTKKEQIEWYVNKSNELQLHNRGELVHSLMFQHIIVPEIYDALIRTSSTTPHSYQRIYTKDKNEFYVLNPENTNAGQLLEYPCPPYYNSGQFSAIANQCDVLAMFFGHDHANTFNVTCQGVDLVATPKAKYSGIGDGEKGIRVIRLNESDTSTYESEVLTFNSLCSLDDLKRIDPSAKDSALEFSTVLVVSVYKLINSLLGMNE